MKYNSRKILAFSFLTLPLLTILFLLLKQGTNRSFVDKSQNKVRAAISCPNPNAAVAISIDRSSSMNSREPDGQPRREWAKNAARAFVQTLIDSGISNIQVSVNSFGHQGNDGTGSRPANYNSTLHIGLSNNYPSVISAINQIQYIASGSCAQCGIRIGNNEVIRSTDRRVVILISDGFTNDTWEGDSNNGRQLTIDEADWGRERNIEYYAIGYGPPPVATSAVLLGVAGDPSRYYYRPNAMDWPGVFLEILGKICGEPTGTPIPTPSSLTPTPTTSSNIILQNVNINGIGATRDIYPRVEPVNSIQGPMTFSLDLPVVNFNPNPDTPGYMTSASGTSLGSTFYYANATDTGGVSVTGRARISVSNSTSWVQLVDGDLVARGDVVSIIPPTCRLPLCSPFLISGTESAPGVANAGRGVYLGSGTASRDPYNYTVTNNLYNGRLYDYAYFEDKAYTVDFTSVSGSVYSGNDLTTGPLYRGYYWNKSSGDLTIEGNINLGQNKIVLFTEGNLYIKGKINLTKGRGFFLVFAGGDIIVDSSVSDSGVLGSRPDNVPELEGLYFANNLFMSDTAGFELDKQLHIRGSVAARRFDLLRELPDNASIPSELFEYAPELNLMIPSGLGLKRTIWREIAP